ncbi:MAG: hypothetical protein ABR612_13960 [Chromatocurvus sp.]
MPSEHVMAHQRTLQAMGLTLYVARFPLPGAAASPDFAESPASPGARGEPLAQDGQSASGESDNAPVKYSAGQQSVAHEPPPVPGAQALGSAASLDVEPVIEPAPLRKTTTMDVSPALASFTLAAVALGGCLWIEELPDGVLGRDQVQLMRAICHALGWPVEPLTINQFTWPMHGNPQFDQGADAAMAALSAFVGRQMGASQCSRLILLGSSARDRLGEAASGTSVLCTQSTRDMLANPLLKRDAWRDLRQQ